MSTANFSLSSDDKERVIKAAFEAREFSYSRYSHFRVGAALLSTTGEIFKGTNVENASYGGAICAERTALVKAVSEGTRSFIALAVVTDVKETLSPCGICRQFIREFCAPTMPILLVPSNYEERVAQGDANLMLETNIQELLPHSFGPEDLERPREP